ncbi:MAG: cyclic nucleotide-binding domain-containing protein [Candidatus Marinimicrobia bacterium]|nr:cyclic nucleotide-binding domain-containing protein [Candidatus Neomarinimicrobiota bacterium]MBL7109751.1 cyclic nucleotide-binding domain-containing protein [Candidatus Neomarinimicrobiota bacterium]
MKITIEKLKTYRIFDNLENKIVEKFHKKLKLKTIPKDRTIIKEGEEGDSLIFLLDGEASISQVLTLMTNRHREDNREKEVKKISAKDYPVFGEISLFSDNEKRSATITALTDCHIGILMENDFFAICESHPDIGYKVLGNLSRIISNHLIKANKDILKLTTAFSLILEK